MGPDISSEEALRRAVLAARDLSDSTGPSGGALAQLFARWGITDAIAARALLAFMRSTEAAQAQYRQGMEPA
jgi:molybdate transport system substrate-binding protein